MKSNTATGASFARALLGATSGLALAGFAFAAQAQQRTTADAAQVDDVVVTGDRVVDTIVEERLDPGVIDIVPTGDIALNSQTNIADLARRLPGVSVSFDMGRNQTATGEAQYATIRGFDTAYNAYTLDGLRLPQTSGGRSISLNLFSPFAVAGINLDKTPGATKDADAIAGVIDLATPSAFDFTGPLTRVRSLGQFAELAHDRDQDAFGGAIGADLARRFGDQNQFGFYGAAYFEQRDSAAESVAVQSDYRTSRANVGTARANGDNLSGVGLQWNFFNSRIERYGVTTALDYRTAAMELFARINYAVYNNTNNMNQSGLRNELTSSIAGVTPVVVQTNPNPGGGAYNAAGDYTPYGINPANYFRTEDVEQELFSAQIGGKYRFGDLTASLEAAYADGRFDSPRRIEAAWRAISYIGTPGNTGAAREGLVLDLSDPRAPRPVLSAGATAYALDLNNQPQRYIVEGYEYLSEAKSTVKGDLTWVGTDLVTSAAVGGLHEDSTRDGSLLRGDDRTFSFRTPTQGGSLYNGAVVVGPTYAQVPGTRLNQFMGTSIARPMILVDRDFIEAQIAQYVAPQTPSAAAVNRNLTDGQESRSAAYATATLKLGALEVIPGLRYEQNHFEARFYLNDADGARFISADRDYDHLDPTLLAVWRPSETLVVRGAARSSYTRPSFDQLAGPTSISRDPGTSEIIAISQPNPDLAPVESWNYDLGLEYYGRDGTVFQAAVYRKDLENLLVTSTTRQQTVGGIVYSRPENGLTGSATGIEISGRYSLASRLDGGWLSGFGIGGNVTLQETEADYRVGTTTRTGALPQAPDLIYNAELFYDLGRLRANLWYNFTDKRLAAIQDSQPDIYVQPLSQLNLGVAYALTPVMEMGFSVRNLLDAETYWTTVGESKTYISNDRNGGYLETGRVFQVSLTATF
ncbi:hypothetical protein BZG35_12440 [Brevundimonas sp. LM2]|uniref:TonB-dependent receptor n=1 Tax=Brevundimonas sp. LM2 TaxID=1938605 RepID=UPI000983A153|nr:TonB-dependent receptor [Brevundimonas sp. LM2]AQR62361.1 hypothetical protein BZG35_12440 [Brevundimonas sp. LM2]